MSTADFTRRDINDLRVYVFVRKDQTRKQQMISTGHAIDERPRFINDFGSPNVIYLVVDSQQALNDVAARLGKYKIGYNVWSDPDNEVCGVAIEKEAIATEPITRKQGSVLSMYRPWTENDYTNTNRAGAS